jgi:hypothetical protein
MKPLPWPELEPYRRWAPYAPSKQGDDYGMFDIPHRPTGVVLKVYLTPARFAEKAGLAKEYAWDHVSVSLPKRTPNWPEMEYVKRLLFRDDETVMQLHVPVTDHRNLHPFCLHLWRPAFMEIPRPPSNMVAVEGSLEDNIEHWNSILAGSRHTGARC